MFTMIYNVITIGGIITWGIGSYKLFVKKDKMIAFLLFAYAFFVLAVSNVIEKDYIMVVLNEILAIIYYCDYLKQKEKEAR